jgi:hypothetical protein
MSRKSLYPNAELYPLHNFTTFGIADQRCGQYSVTYNERFYLGLQSSIL